MNINSILLETLKGFLIGFWKLWVPIIVIVIVLSVIRLIFLRSKNINNSSTSLARKLGNLLKEYGWNVEFEKWDGYKHIDIAITEARTNIEVDGSQHNLNQNQALADQKRDFYSLQKGFVTKRIPNSVLKDDIKAKEIAQLLNKELEERVRELKKSA